MTMRSRLVVQGGSVGSGGQHERTVRPDAGESSCALLMPTCNPPTSVVLVLAVRRLTPPWQNTRLGPVSGRALFQIVKSSSQSL